MKTLFFKGITELGLFTQVILLNPNVNYESTYSFGALKISFNTKDSKTIGRAIGRCYHSSKFRQVPNPQ